MYIYIYILHIYGIDFASSSCDAFSIRTYIVHLIPMRAATHKWYMINSRRARRAYRAARDMLP